MVNRTVTPEVAAQVTEMMEGVVERGTATYAQIPGYTVAGKTGTAEKWVDGAYSDTEHMASFVGFVPSRHPVYTIVVVVDSPHGKNGHFGGPVAAPVFKRVAEDLLRYGGVPPTLNAPPPVLVHRGDANPGEQRISGPAQTGSVVAARLDAAVSDGRYPDLSGMSARDAIRVMAALGAQPQVYGTGFVSDQRPAAGAPIESGDRVTLWLSRRPPVAQAASVDRP